MAEKKELIPNRISAVLSEEDIKEIKGHLGAINAKLSFLVSLTPDEEDSLLKVGDKGRQFIRRALAVAPHLVEYLPRSFSLEEMQKDVTLMDQLAEIQVDISQLGRRNGLGHTIVSSESYAAALEIYRVAKKHGHAEGLDKTVDELGKLFARRFEQSTPSAEPDPGKPDPKTGK